MAAVVRRRAPAPVRAALHLPLVGPRLLSRILVSGLPTGPGPARFSRPGQLEKVVAAAGFQAVRRESRAYPIEFESFDAYWDAVTRGTPAIEIARRLDAATIAGVQEESRARLVNGANGRILTYNEAILVLAKKPA
jgi:hypothetical protein